MAQMSQETSLHSKEEQHAKDKQMAKYIFILCMLVTHVQRLMMLGAEDVLNNSLKW